jgi:hypothetical protein
MEIIDRRLICKHFNIIVFYGQGGKCKCVDCGKLAFLDKLFSNDLGINPKEF